MKKENKKEPVKCEVKPNPTAVLKYTVENMRAGMKYEAAKEKAAEDALAAKKYHGVSKLRCELMEAISKELAADKEPEETEEAEIEAALNKWEGNGRTNNSDMVAKELAADKAKAEAEKAKEETSE